MNYSSPLTTSGGRKVGPPLGIRLISLYTVSYGLWCALMLLVGLAASDLGAEEWQAELLLLSLDVGVFLTLAIGGVGLRRLKAWGWQFLVVLYGIGALASTGLLNAMLNAVSSVPGVSLRFSIVSLGTRSAPLELAFHLGIIWYLARAKIRVLFGRVVWWRPLDVRRYVRCLKMPGLLSDMPIGDGYRTIIVLALAVAACWAMIQLSLPPRGSGTLGAFVTAFIFMSLFYGEIIVFFGGFLSGGLLHLVARWRGGQGTFEASTKIAFMAVMLGIIGGCLGDLIVIGVLRISGFDSNSSGTVIWGLVAYEGLRSLHQMDRKAAVITIAYLYGTSILVTLATVLLWIRLIH